MKTQFFAKNAALFIIFSIFVFSILFFSSCATSQSLSSENEEITFATKFLTGSGGFKFKITESYWTNNYKGNKPKNSYLVVETAITNPGDEPSTFKEDHKLFYRAISDNGVEYAPSVNENEANFPDYAINPKMSSKGELAFDIPKGQYQLKMMLYNDSYADQTLSFGITSGVRESYYFPLNPKNK